MSFSINTNVASLQAMNYLTNNQRFQNKTIAEVTSGLRIVNSGDDAAGLAVANQYAAQQAVLNQGIQNANDGLATLQTIDGGMSNISQLLNRASTLATQSASGTFQGSRTVLDNEFQSVLSEINRQAQNIGMNTGGAFNKSLSVFIGGGRDVSGNQNNSGAVTEGSVSVNLTGSAVDTQSLGLTGYGVQTAALGNSFFTTYGGSSGTTSALKFYGPGFSDTNAVSVNVNTLGVGDINSLVTAINAGITAAGQGGTPQASAFKAANIVATANSDGTISFTSSNSAFQITDDGSVQSQNLLSGASAAVYDYAQGTYRHNTTGLGFTTMAIADSQKLTFSAVDANGNLQKKDITLTGVAYTGATAVGYINSQLQASGIAALQDIVAVQDGAATIGFTSSKAFNVTIGVTTGTPADGITTSVGTTQSATVPGSDTTTFNSSIATAAGAQAAVTAIGNAVANLGNAQAAVGKGENTLTYATNLAQSQSTNEATSESGLRDANMATEAANLTKAQILLQAGVAALAQANAAPQNILALLKG